MTIISLDPVILAYVFGLGLLFFSIWKPHYIVFVAIIATMFGIIVAGDQGSVGSWSQAGAIVMIVYCAVRMLTMARRNKGY